MRFRARQPRPDRLSWREGQIVYDQLASRVASLLSRPRALVPQTERQLTAELAERGSTMTTFLLCAAEVLEDHELDILFAPVFTPTLQERAEVADLLFHWRPTTEQLQQLVTDVCARHPHAIVRLPDGTQAKLTLHEVMVERYVRLLRLDNAPDPATSAGLREVLRAELWPLGVALLCEHGMTPTRQRWIVAFVNHMSARHAVSRELLETVADFILSQHDLKPSAMVLAAEALLRATQGTAAYTAGGHAYWSPDVAQHHHYRGEGKIDQQRLEQRQAEVQRVTTLVDDLRTFRPAETCEA
jgi:hypothetical protein